MDKKRNLNIKIDRKMGRRKGDIWLPLVILGCWTWRMSARTSNRQSRIVRRFIQIIYEVLKKADIKRFPLLLSAGQYFLASDYNFFFFKAMLFFNYGWSLREDEESPRLEK